MNKIPEINIEANNGWVLLWRKTLNSPIMQAKATIFKVWIWCLLKANHENKKVAVDGKEILIKRGQFITGRTKACKELHCTPQNYKTACRYLKSTQRITLEPTHHYTIITVVNYDKYQDIKKILTQQKIHKLTNAQHTPNTRLTTNNNDNNDNNDNKYIDEIRNYWNSLKTSKDLGISENLAKNKTAIKKLLPECRSITPDIKKAFEKIKGYSEEDFKQAIKNYVAEIVNRSMNSDYCNHRFSFYEFFKQSNGFRKFYQK